MLQVRSAPTPEPYTTELVTKGKNLSTLSNERSVFHTSSADALIVDLTETFVIYVFTSQLDNTNYTKVST